MKISQLIIFTTICTFIGWKYGFATELVFLAGYLTDTILELIDRYLFNVKRKITLN